MVKEPVHIYKRCTIQCHSDMDLIVIISYLLLLFNYKSPDAMSIVLLKIRLAITVMYVSQIVETLIVNLYKILKSREFVKACKVLFPHC